MLLKEIHHRVKNNIQTISSLLSLQSSLVKDEKTAELFREAQSRIRSIGSIHEMLYKSQDLARVNFQEYITSLVSQIFSIYKVDPDRIKSLVDVKDVHLDIDRAIPCGLIISELVSNSLKHAFPGGHDGKIIVKMSQGDHGVHTLVINDNGVGIPEGFDPNDSPTLGILLVADLVRQLRGKIEFRKAEGTEITISF